MGNKSGIFGVYRLGLAVFAYDGERLWLE